jgi:hypothetical protein
VILIITTVVDVDSALLGWAEMAREETAGNVRRKKFRMVTTKG